MSNYNNYLNILSKVHNELQAIKDGNDLSSFLIAGGYIRDLCMTRAKVLADQRLSPHDIDVFINIPPDDELADDIPWLYAEKLAEVLGYNPADAIRVYKGEFDYSGVQKKDEKSKINKILNIYLGEPESFITVQIIGVNDRPDLSSDPEAYVKKEFDIGACMCYYNGTELKMTDVAMVDIMNKQFTIINDTPNSKNRSKKFIQRFYPEPRKARSLKEYSDAWKAIPNGIRLGELVVIGVGDNVHLNEQGMRAVAEQFRVVPVRPEQRVELQDPE